MGRIRRGGYIIVSWIGDHAPRRVHVAFADGRELGRLALDTLLPLEDWTPGRDLIRILEELKREGRL
jgi:hypothetical protein